MQKILKTEQFADTILAKAANIYKETIALENEMMKMIDETI